jgi:hypothetical protein
MKSEFLCFEDHIYFGEFFFSFENTNGEICILALCTVPKINNACVGSRKSAALENNIGHRHEGKKDPGAPDKSTFYCGHCASCVWSGIKIKTPHGDGVG